MQEYFIHEGHKHLGPFSATELIKRRLAASTPLKKWSIAAAALILIIIAIVIFKLREEIRDTGNVSSTADAITQQVSSRQSESVDPSQYLHVQGKMHSNLLGKKIIRGKITNLASFAGYRDLKMAVTFLSGTQKELQTQNFIINDMVAANNEISFRDVFTAPEYTEGFRIKVVSAVPAY